MKFTITNAWGLGGCLKHINGAICYQPVCFKDLPCCIIDVMQYRFYQLTQPIIQFEIHFPPQISFITFFIYIFFHQTKYLKY